MSPVGVVTVVGGGWSVRRIDLTRLLGTVIAVNDSALWLPRWDHAVSMDRLWSENRVDELREMLDPEPTARKVWIRDSAAQNILDKLDRPWAKVFRCDHKTSRFNGYAGALNGMNSGACALNLAWQLNPARVYLLGFDMNRDKYKRAYWYPPYPWTDSNGGINVKKYRNWAQEFDCAQNAFDAIGCEVFNVSPASEIPNFPKISALDYMKASA
jgi:hypothetical protein